LQTTLLGFALALIAAILAAFAAPFFIDWNEWRPQLEAQAGALAGTRVTISGNIDLTLLPTPAFVLRDVSLGDADNGTGMRASEMKGSLSLTALVSGRIEASEFAVSRPAIRLVVEKDGQLLLPAGASAGQEISVGSFVLEAGSLTIEDRRTNSIFLADDFSARGELVSREGPFRLDGGFRLNGMRWILRISSGRFGPDHSGKIRFALERPSDATAFEVEGLLALANAAPRFEGKILAAKRSGTLPWRISSEASGDSSEIRFSNLEVALGQGELPITLSGDGKLKPHAKGALEVSLSSKRIDLDLGDQNAAAAGAAHVLPLLAEAQRLFAALPLAAQVTITADGILAGGQLVRDVRADLRAQNGVAALARLEARLPGRASIHLSGKNVRDTFSGPLSFESEEPQIFARWLLGEKMSATISLGQMLRVKGNLSFAQNEMALRGAEGEIGRTKIKGDAALRPAKDPVKQMLELQLAAENADLDPLLPFLRSVLDGKTGIEFAMKLTATGSRLFGVPAKSVGFSSESVDGETAITRFTIDDLDGFSLNAKQAQAAKGEIAFSATATRTGGLSSALHYLSGSADLAAIAVRYAASHFPLRLSGTLTPVKSGTRLLVKSGDAALALDLGALQDNRQPVEAVLRLPETEIAGNGEFRFGPDGGFEPVLALTLKSADLRKAFVLADRASANALPVIGNANLLRDGNNLVFDKISFELAGTRVTGRVVIPAGALSPYSGTLSLDRADAAALVSLALGRAHVSYVELGVPLLANFPGTLNVEIGSLAISERVSLQKAAFQIRAGRYETVFDDFRGQLAGGKLSGSLRVADVFPRVLEIRLNAADVELPELLGTKALRGALRGTLALSANGNTRDELIASLSGQGTVGLSNFEIDRTDATSVGSVFAAAAKDAPDERNIEQALTAALERAPLKVSKLDAPLVIANGIMRSGSAIARAGNIEISLSGSFNLPKQSIEALLNIEIAGDAAKPGALIRWEGPFTAPARNVDARALVTAITLRAIERGGQTPPNIRLPQEDRVPPAKKKRAPSKSDVESAPLLPPPANIPPAPQPRSQN
jgi:uncharacterized protein involved in outer membrane biogenesis